MSAPPCAICASPAKYTCPRCATRTCSLPCINTHKQTTACTGQRDRAAFVPLKEYGYGKLMDDYVFLEDGKRRAEAWGKEISGMKGVGAGTGTGTGAGVSGKCVALQRALNEVGIRVHFMPEGMEKRRKNQSHYNPKTHLIQLSMEFKYPSPDPLTPHQPTTAHPTHQMQNIPLNETSSLAQIYTRNARKTPPHYPQPTTDSTTNEAPGLVFALPFYEPTGPALPIPPPEPHANTSPHAQRFYGPLNPTDPLNVVLSGTSFLEYPAVHVFLAGHWEELEREGRVTVVPRRSRPPPPTTTTTNGGNSRKGREGGGRPAPDAERSIPAKKARIEEPLEGSPLDDSSVEERPTVVPQPTSNTPSVQPTHDQPLTDEAVMRPVDTPGLLSLDYGTESEEGG